MSRRVRWRLVPGSSDHPFVRALLLLCVFVLAGMAFWWNFERRMEALRRMDIQDSARILAAEEMDALLEMQRAFKANLGINVEVRVEPGALRVPISAAPALFVGVGLAHREAVVMLPPLASRVMGEGRRCMVEDDLRQCLARERPGVCLRLALNSLWDSLWGAGKPR